MIQAGELSAEDTVVEIGPGFGVLTFALAEHVKKVIAFEIERTLELYWDDVLQIQKNVKIVWGDALSKVQSSEFEVQNYKVIANLPYQITSKVLRTFLELENKPERVIVMVQKEVAERICAKPGDMSLLSVSVQFYGEPKIIVKVPKGSFWPSPKVDSAVVAITNIQEKKNAEQFFAVVRAAFSQKRKQAWKNIATQLKFSKGKVQEVLKAVVGNEKVRAEEISVESWESIVSQLYM